MKARIFYTHRFLSLILLAPYPAPTASSSMVNPSSGAPAGGGLGGGICANTSAQINKVRQVNRNTFCTQLILEV